MTDDPSALMQWLATVESSSLATWVRESGSVWAYPTVLTLHTAGLGILVGANAVLDLRLLGAANVIPIAPLMVLFRFMWAGLAVNAISGVLLFIADATTKVHQTIFLMKLALITLALLTAVRLRRYLTARAEELASGVVSAHGRRLAWISLALWAAAITAGRLMAYL